MPETDRQSSSPVLFPPGGFSAGRTLADTFSFFPRLRRWRHNCAMTFPRCDHGMAATKDGIFCIGGRTLKGVSPFALVIPELIQNGVCVRLGPGALHQRDGQ